MKQEWTLLLLLMSAGSSLAARILGIVPTPAYSHQMPFLAIMRALAERGHQVTVITTEPLKDPPKNFTQIDISFTKSTVDVSKIVMEMGRVGPVEAMEGIQPITERLCKLNFEFPQIKKLLESPERFDVVVLETFLLWCYFGVVHGLGSPPVVGYVSSGLSETVASLVGGPFHPAYMPCHATAHSPHMGFWQRLHNAYLTLRLQRSLHRVILPFHDALVRRHFGPGVPSLTDLVHNVSLLVTGSDLVLSYPQPLAPNVVQTTGVHIPKTRKLLPKDIQLFLDGAENGFIYFSLGSNLKSSHLPETVRHDLLKAFARLPQRVLWKLELDDLPERPDNVMIAKWLPQTEVLAHRNIRLFFTHGGLLSLGEAAYYGVPLLAMPLFGDQQYNVGKITSAGVGEKIEFRELSTDSVLRAIRHVMDNPRYKENMQRFSAVFREHQERSLDSAVWWIEYVVRHRGAPHMRSAALDLRWWQLLLLDVIAFLLAVVAFVGFLLYKLVQWLLTVVTQSNKIKKH